MSSQIPNKYVSLEVQNDVTIATLNESRLTNDMAIEATAQELIALIEEQLAIIISFGHVKFLSSSFLGKLKTFRRLMLARSGTLVLCGMSEEITQLFELTNLSILFRIEKTRELALVALQRSPLSSTLP